MSSSRKAGLGSSLAAGMTFDYFIIEEALIRIDESTLLPSFKKCFVIPDESASWRRNEES